MDKYISQLIEKLAEAEANPTPETDFGNSYEEFEEKMLAIETEEPSAAERVINVSYDELPPPERLSDEQMERLIEAICNALQAKGTLVSFPGDDVPAKLRYSALRDYFKEGFFTFPGWNIDFCDGWCPDCEFFNYCKSWQDTWTKEDIEKERAKPKHDI